MKALNHRITQYTYQMRQTINRLAAPFQIIPCDIPRFFLVYSNKIISRPSSRKNQSGNSALKQDLFSVPKWETYDEVRKPYGQ